MSDRVVVTLGAGAPAAVSRGPRAARFVIAGTTGRGPADRPVAVTSLAAYRRVFGDRVAGPDMYDAAAMFLGSGAGELVVLRAAGPAVKAATKDVGTGITVTARDPGAWANTVKVGWTQASHTLTIDYGGGRTSTFVGADVAALAAAVASSSDFAITVTALPSGDVAPAALAGGTDDHANVDWEKTLALIPAYTGPGAVATPGVDAHEKLAAFAAKANMLALVGAAAGDDAAAVKAKQAAAAGLTAGSSISYCYPRVVRDNVEQDPVGYFAALRGLAIREGGPGTSPILRRVHQLVPGVTLATPVTDEDWRSLEAVGVIVGRALPAGTGCDSYGLAKPLNGNPNLSSAAFLDLVCAVRHDVEDVLDRFFGFSGTPAELTQIASEVAGAVDAYRAHLVGEVDGEGKLIHPGYRVSADRGVDPADNRITVRVALRLAEEIDWVDLVLTVADASQSI